MLEQNVSRRDFVKTAGATLAIAASSARMPTAAAQDEDEDKAEPRARQRRGPRDQQAPLKPAFGERPNILLLMADQHSARVMSCAGHPVIRTPHMDRLAQEGIHFAHTYCPTPLCVPSRVSVLTGRFSHNTGLLRNSGILLEGEPTFAQALRNAGYHTSITGKIHLAQGAPPGSPECDERLRQMGFDDATAHNGKVAEGINVKGEDSYQKYLKEKGVFEKFQEDYTARHGRGKDRRPHWYAEPSVLSEEDYHDAYIGRVTRDWILNYKDDKPFFCWCNWGGPHAPWDAPGKYAQMYDPANVDPAIQDPLDGAPQILRNKQEKQTGAMPPDAWRACRAQYYGMINVVDDAIGSMLDALDKRGMLDNTIVIYTSDHGEMLFDHGFFGKSLMYEQAAAVPLLIRWPKHFQKRFKSQALTSTLDLVPALLSVAGAGPMAAIHGISLLPVLTGKAPSHQEEVFSEMEAMKMVRRGDSKYIYDPAWDKAQLFNLKDDPDELKNLSGAPEVAELERALHDRLLDWMIQTEVRPNTAARG